MESSGGGRIVIGEDWSDAAETLTLDTSTSSSQSIIVICGPKNSGKTTFSRHLLNTLLSRHNKVAYLDTDVGQTEFTPPGCLSLTVIDEITPDLAIPCLRTPQRCFFFGDLSSKRDPTRYKKCIFALYDYYKMVYYTLNQSESRSKTEIPLIVNTSGWVKGIGYSSLVDIIQYLTPSHVVKINSHHKNKNLPDGLFWLSEDNNGRHSLIEINSPDWNKFIDVRKDSHFLRDLRLKSYFRQCLPRNINITMVNELALALASHPPYEVSISSVKIMHLFCDEMQSPTPDSIVFHSLNATIVGLAISAKDSELSQCVGLGIVRGIDLSKQLLYVITPVPHTTLEKVDLLQQGFVQIPTHLLQIAGCTSPYIAAKVLSAR